MVARAYPEAKRALIAQGRPAAEVEAMPAIQVVALHSYKLYEEARDDIFKWAGLPYWQGYKGMSEAEQHPRAGWDKLKGGIPFRDHSSRDQLGLRRAGPGRTPARTWPSTSRRFDSMRPVTTAAAAEPGGDHRGAGADRSGDRKVFQLQAGWFDRDPDRAGASWLSRIFLQYKINYELKLAR